MGNQSNVIFFCPSTLSTRLTDLLSAIPLHQCLHVLYGQHQHMQNKQYPALHDCCRIIADCQKPINIDSLYLLVGISPPDIRQTVASHTERLRQVAGTKHQLHNHMPAASRLKSQKSFMNTIKPLNSSPSGTRLEKLQQSLKWDYYPLNPYQQGLTNRGV